MSAKVKYFSPKFTLCLHSMGVFIDWSLLQLTNKNWKLRRLHYDRRWRRRVSRALAI